MLKASLIVAGVAAGVATGAVLVPLLVAGRAQQERHMREYRAEAPRMLDVRTALAPAGHAAGSDHGAP